MLAISYKPSTAHWLFPPIIIGILIFLLIIMIVRRGIKCRKEKRPFFSLGRNYFLSGGDMIKFLGTPILLALYIICMGIIGFLASSMIFLFLYNLLYSGLPGFTGIAGNITTGKITKTLCKPLFHSVLISLLVSVIASMVIWLLFSYIFKIALP